MARLNLRASSPSSSGQMPRLHSHGTGMSLNPWISVGGSGIAFSRSEQADARTSKISSADMLNLARLTQNFFTSHIFTQNAKP